MKETTLISLIIIFGCFQGGHNDERSKLCFKEKKNQSKSGTCPEPGQPNDFTSCCKEPEYSDGFRFVCCPQNQKNSENTREVIIKEQQIFMKGTAASNARSLFGEIEINNTFQKDAWIIQKQTRQNLVVEKKSRTQQRRVTHIQPFLVDVGVSGVPINLPPVLLYACISASDGVQIYRRIGSKTLERLTQRTV